MCPTKKKDICNIKLLMVGAGGIGCELLKTLVVTGFTNIEIIDLDTIEVSNLNRQFLFNKSHVGQSKAQVAKESILKLTPKANIVAHHADIHSAHFDLEFFKSFDIVLNALDNRAARSRVNKMCILTNVPMIDGGTAGFLGQLHVIKKSVTECYDCEPKSENRRKSYPICTIRNTPSEMIHCVVWSKYLFELLFSTDEQNDTRTNFDSTSTNDQKDIEDDEELLSSKIKHLTLDDEAIRDFIKFLLQKYFNDDINKLLTMSELWQERAKPTPLDKLNNSFPFDDIFKNGVSINEDLTFDSFKTTSLQKYISVFVNSANNLFKRWFISGSYIKWDKDDDLVVNFTASAANIRATIFGIALETKFEIKSMAGNIIPAIATTNAIIAGLMVAEALKIIQGNINKCHSVYISKNVNSTKLLLPCKSDPPNANCPVCADKPYLFVQLDIDHITVAQFEQFIKAKCLFEEFDVVDQATGKIIISGDDSDTIDKSKPLSYYGLKNGCFLTVEDFNSDWVVEVNLSKLKTDNTDLNSTIQTQYNNLNKFLNGFSRKRSSSVSGIIVNQEEISKKVSKLDTPPTSDTSGEIVIEGGVDDSDCEIIIS